MDIILGCYLGYIAFSWALGFDGLSGRDTHKSHFINKVIWFLVSPCNFIYHRDWFSERAMEASSAWVGLLSIVLLVVFILVRIVWSIIVPLWLWLPFVGGAVGFVLWCIAAVKD